MSEALVFSCNGNPRGKGRPRTRIQRTRGGDFAQLYTDEKTRAYEAGVARLARAAMKGRTPFIGPLSVSLRFRFKPAESLPKYKRAALLAGEEAYFGVYDVDNLAKAVLDGMNKVAYGDDKQITRLFVTKVAAEKAGFDVKVEPLGPQVSS
ncbi:MAG: RusA family crossover junction endodeoxyribonuclease [Caulobacterales bacterium]|nr:RusA family crossover junction endodeoxyribonuclease [Caulobacterales bacterium]